MIKTKHVAFRPIDVKMGPDGAIYIADWYNPIIQHGEVDFRDPRRDHVHGRIWRLTYKGRKTVQLPEIAAAPVSELLNLLKSNEEWVRLHAKRMLKEKKRSTVHQGLVQWNANLDPTDPRYEHHLLEALWTFQSIRTVNVKLLETLLSSTDHRVRAAAVRVAVEWRNHLKDLDAFQVFSNLVKDDHPRVRIEAVRALSLYQNAQAATNSLMALERPMDFNLDFALWKTIRQLKDQWLPTLTAGEFDFNENLDHLTFALRSVDSPTVIEPLFALANQETTSLQKKVEIFSIIGSQGNSKTLGRIARFAVDLANSDQQTAAKMIRQLSIVCRRRNIRPDFAEQPIIALTASNDQNLANAAIEAIGVWKIQGGRQTLNILAESNSLPAIDGLALLGGPESKRVLVEIAESKAPYPVRQR
ncbi:MAG: HEAT repeat domain-containing protein, partial [Planctomycetota bacterium]|nr:HEAT repeat domain-containing protein [Planctomycetota bacterium]